LPRILVYDVGTTSVKAALVDTETLMVTASTSGPLPMTYTSPREAVIRPRELWSTVSRLSRSLMSRLNEPPSGLTIISQMAGVLPVDGEGRPLYDIMTWLDERAAGLPRSLFQGFPMVSGYNLWELLRFLRITGGAPSKTGKDAISKILWLKEVEKDIWRRTSVILDVKGFLHNIITGERITTVDEANLSWLMDTRPSRSGWSNSILDKYGIPAEMLPRIVQPSTVIGEVKPGAAAQLGVPEGTPVVAGAGDVAGVAVGSGMVRPGETHLYLGTSNWLAAHTEKRLLDVFHYMGSLLSAIPGRYLFIAEQEVAGGALEWLLDKLKCHGERYRCLEESVKKAPPGSRGVLFAPWMYGERSPIDDDSVRGVFFNLSLSHGDPELVRAVIEGVAYNVRFAYDYYVKHIGVPRSINIVGGGALLDEWCQVMADLLGVEVRRTVQPRMVGARGGAVIAGVGLGYYRSFEEAAGLIGIERIFEPRGELRDLYESRYRFFVDLYKSTRRLFRRMNTHG